jgi:hypothetical protein
VFLSAEAETTQAMAKQPPPTRTRCAVALGRRWASCGPAAKAQEGKAVREEQAPLAPAVVTSVGIYLA